VCVDRLEIVERINFLFIILYKREIDQKKSPMRRHNLHKFCGRSIF